MPNELMNKKKFLGGVYFLQMTKCEKSTFSKKKFFQNFFKKFFCTSDLEFFSDSKMVLLFEKSPKLADLRRILFSIFENWHFPFMMRGSPWGTLRGKNFSKNGPNDHNWTCFEGLWWKMGQKNFFFSKCLIIQIQSQLLSRYCDWKGAFRISGTQNTVRLKPLGTPVSILNSKNRDGCPEWFGL